MNQNKPKKLIEAGSEVVASVSGGKDSAAMCLWLREQGIEHRRVFSDTGWEHPKTYEYLVYLEAVFGRIDRISGPLPMVELIEKKGMFPGQTKRFCTQALKFDPIRKYLSEIDDPINAVGIRRKESRKRQDAKILEFSDDLDAWVWRPLAEWSEGDVIDIHRRHGLKPNPLYLMGADRVGCWPCIYARKSEIRMISEIDPGRIDQVRELETKVREKAAATYAAKGETFESKGLKPPTFFALKVKQFDADGNAIRDERGHQIRKGEMRPIDEVVEWSKTVRGGGQYAMFSEIPQDAGCMKWGMCE